MSHLLPRLDAMKPAKPGATRTAPPRPPDGFPGRAVSAAGAVPPGRATLRRYIAFGCGGFFLFTVSLLVLRAVWALGNGEAAWNRVQTSFQNPLYVIFHTLAFLWITWFILRLFRLFPATQPKRIGPFKRPPDGVLVAGLSGAFVVVTLALAAILLGAL
jgi:fumarate reductase subunit C